MPKSSAKVPELSTWFDNWEQQLQLRAKAAGLLRHPTLTGDLREFLVCDVLRSFLPAPYEIGSGIAFTSAGEYSHQLDIVIYDSRLPVLRQPDGVSMFPIESVAAYIEVKSTLDAKELNDGFKKCTRLMSLGKGFSFSEEDSNELVTRRAGRTGSLMDAKRQRSWFVLPRTYIFALDGLRSSDSLGDRIQKWVASNDFEILDENPLLPSMVSSGGALALLWGDPIRIAPRPEADDHEIPESVLDRGLYILYDITTRFGLIACHLLWALEHRSHLGQLPGGMRPMCNVRSVFEHYLGRCAGGGMHKVFSTTQPIRGKIAFPPPPQPASSITLSIPDGLVGPDLGTSLVISPSTD